MIQILIADDNEVARGIVSEMLQNHDGWNVCAQVANGREAVSKAMEMKPQVVILDLAMPEMDGLTAACEIAKAMPSVAVLIYTLHEKKLFELEAKKAGVRRVISKMAAPENLVLAVEQMLREEENAVKTTPITVETVPGPLGEINTGAAQSQPIAPPAPPPAASDPSNKTS